MPILPQKSPAQLPSPAADRENKPAPSDETLHHQAPSPRRTSNPDDTPHTRRPPGPLPSPQTEKALPQLTAPDRPPAGRYPRSKASAGLLLALKAWARSSPETAGSGWPSQKTLHKDNRYDKSFSGNRSV